MILIFNHYLEFFCADVRIYYHKKGLPGKLEALFYLVVQHTGVCYLVVSEGIVGSNPSTTARAHVRVVRW